MREVARSRGSDRKTTQVGEQRSARQETEGPAEKQGSAATKGVDRQKEEEAGGERGPTNNDRVEKNMAKSSYTGIDAPGGGASLCLDRCVAGGATGKTTQVGEQEAEQEETHPPAWLEAASGLKAEEEEQLEDM